MRKYLILVLLLISSILFPQNFKNDSIKLFIDQTIELIERNSIYTQNIEGIKKDLYEKTVNFNSLDEVAPLFQKVFKQLNDHHGNLKYKRKTYGWSLPSVCENEYLKAKLKSDKSVVSQMINDKIGYIRIPGNNDFAFKKVDSITSDITSKINSVNSENIKGWIIDLRTNTGGNMYPIMLSIKDFIGNNLKFWGFKNARGEDTGSWDIKADKLMIDGIELESKTKLTYLIPNEIPLVILTSCYTASAGEMTAISLIGRKNTSIVGEPTANFTTAVQGYKINDFAGINLSTDYVVDRNQTVYKNSISPDYEIMGGDNFEDLNLDTKIQQALKLLK